MCACNASQLLHEDSKAGLTPEHFRLSGRVPANDVSQQAECSFRGDRQSDQGVQEAGPETPAQDEVTDLKSNLCHWTICRKEPRSWPGVAVVPRSTQSNFSRFLMLLAHCQTYIQYFCWFRSQSAPGVLADCSTSPTPASRASSCSVVRKGTTLASFFDFLPASWLAESSKSLFRVSTILRKRVFLKMKPE